MTDLVPGPRDLPAAPEALAAARRIQALWDIGRVIMDLVQAETMECLLTIRTHVPDRQRFSEFVERHTPLNAGKAWLMAETWSAARKHDGLRKLASRQPEEALELVRTAVKSGVDLADETDERVQRILTMSPRRRHSAIRKLIDAGDRDAVADRERIRGLRAERDDAVKRLDDLALDGGRSGRFLSRLRECAGWAADRRMDAQILLPEAPPAVRKQAAAMARAIVASARAIEEMVENGETAP